MNSDDNIGGEPMSWENPSNDQMAKILKEARSIAVVGLSDNPGRTSYQIAKEMQRHGYKIIPVNPMVEKVLGEKAYSSLLEINEPIDIINVFRRSEFLPEIAKEAVQTNCSVFWAQLGVVNEEAYHFLQNNDVTVIMDTCIKVVHSIYL